MLRSKRSLLLLATALVSAGSVWAQSESQIEGDEVKRVGSHLNCQCGGCKDDVNCMMSGGQCHFCKPARTKIFQTQQMSGSGPAGDAAIIATFVKEYGEKVFRPDPDSSFWLVPYLSAFAGLGIVALVLVKMRSSARKHGLTPSAAGGPPIDDATFSRYRDAIEKDTDRLE
jgi:cytochrome c-type biogenesis protein CcmH/NrfF